MSRRTYDLVVVGGGITGACVARDAALRGLSVALVDKGDFGHATTAASSKLIHGGLRYLRYLQFGVVRDSLHERRVWANTAPHLIEPMTFLVPTFDARAYRRMELAAALTAYDLLSFDRNRLLDPDKHIGRHRVYSREQAIAIEPALESTRLSGAMTFTDYQMYSPERLSLECVLDAVTHGADVANYAEVKRFLVEERRVHGVEVADGLRGGAMHTLRGRMVVNACGAWADMYLGELGSTRQPRRLIRSKGIHLLTRPLTRSHGLGIQTDKAHFFIIPWRGHSLIGTTDTLFQGNPDECRVLEQDIADFLAIVNEALPGLGLGRADVQYFYAGLRPIVDMEAKPGKDEGGTYEASRAAEVYDHEAHDGLAGGITAIGGKWTTSRSLARKVVDLAFRRMGRKPPPCTTDVTPTHGGATGPFEPFVREALARHAGQPAGLVQHLARNYGTRMDALLELAGQQPDWAAPLAQGYMDIGAQVAHAVREEMAVTLDDVLFRRTGLGTLGYPGDAGMERVSGILAGLLDWDAEERRAQVEGAMARYAAAQGSTPSDG
ncbi:MAG: aerobic glycerol-3-phosphate dehydrogenase [Candidatus Hydrogenedentota bacterium]|jgi:glycerol-3-phosphate dehydrogenase